MDRQAERSGRTRQHILEAAEQIFAEKGLDGARVDEIAALSGANKRMIYAYFGSKEELYRIVLERIYRRLSEWERFLTDSPEGRQQDVRAALASLVRAYFTFLRENPSYVRMLMWENLYEARHFDAMELGKVRDPLRRALRALLEQGKREGRFRADADEQQVLMTLFACPFNFFSNIHTMSRVMQTDLSADGMIEARAEAVIDMMLTYLAADGKRALQ